MPYSTGACLYITSILCVCVCVLRETEKTIRFKEVLSLNLFIPISFLVVRTHFSRPCRSSFSRKDLSSLLIVSSKDVVCFIIAMGIWSSFMGTSRIINIRA